MSYEKQTWVDGQTIIAAKLNHMENGIALENVFVVEFTSAGPNEWAATHDGEPISIAEIIAAIDDNIVMCQFPMEEMNIIAYVTGYSGTSMVWFSANIPTEGDGGSTSCAAAIMFGSNDGSTDNWAAYTA